MKLLSEKKKDLTKGVIKFTELVMLYRDDSEETLKKFANKILKYSGQVTSIQINSPKEYRIHLDNIKGKIIIDKVELDPKLNKELWAGKKPCLTFSAKWTGTGAGSHIFR